MGIEFLRRLVTKQYGSDMHAFCDFTSLRGGLMVDIIRPLRFSFESTLAGEKEWPVIIRVLEQI